jgi:glutathione synthase/RimK-type ligase-like ATP-grasp enzyme
VLRTDTEKLYVLTLAEKAEQKFLLTELKHQLYTPLNDRQSYFLTADKSRTVALLKKIGLEYPQNIFEVKADNLDAVKDYEVTDKVVVKPHASHGGQGVTVVTDTASLLPSLQKALTYSHTALVQEYAVGEEHRLLCIDGEFTAAFRSRPACVHGDGELTIRELIEHKNLRKSDKLYQGTRSKIKIDRAETFMGSKGLDWTPADGELVILDSISNISFGGDAIDVTDDVSDVLKEKVAELCKMASLGVVGVDVISSDISSDDLSLHKVTELNGSPGLRPHLLVEEGASRNVAIDYVNALEKYVDLRYNPVRKALAL